MIQIGDTLISDELVTKPFTCDLQKCKGACCVQGDSGAPLEENEVKILKDIFPKLKPFLRPAGVKAIEQQGTSVVDTDDERVTPLVGGKECAYVVFENGIARCGIEKAYQAGAVAFRKPVSCYLYPVRIKKGKAYDSVNYDIWSICDAARDLGSVLNTPVYQFTGPALRQKYGEEWYNKLKKAALAVTSRPSGDGAL